MANDSSISRILGAAILSVSATYLLAVPVHANVNTDIREPGQVISDSNTLVRLSANSARQLIDQGARRMLVPQQQATGNQTATGTLSSGATQQPQLGTAGEEMKKIIKNLPKPHCGGPHSIC